MTERKENLKNLKIREPTSLLLCFVVVVLFTMPVYF